MPARPSHEKSGEGVKQALMDHEFATRVYRSKAAAVRAADRDRYMDSAEKEKRKG